ncbi:nucleic acid dioxygenase ALKBH1 [Erpetoichthys calabaricus]|uniref:Nucleic acid dioxygenase ALKBH1 n=1 Tax=Erpetoichthys calabaricus TaxID=27687 RepID=A0A8C4TEP3_ERPCA|nr:nucleic acid dioxygenase ALKBH1 [Erpetoichthys calabaricus]
MAASVLEQGEDAFRKLFRFYKRRNPPPDFSNVLDFSKPETHFGKVFTTDLSTSAVSDNAAHKCGLHPVRKWKAFSLDGYPGFIFITNPFLPGTQRYWVKQCLKTYTQKPNICNLDMHMSQIETENLWEKSLPGMRLKDSVKRAPKTLLEKLRWVTLGYHYNWDTKTYSADRYTPFPNDLHALSEKVAAICGFQNFSAEAGILNYYHFDSSLGIHVDESELDHSQPLLSFSFGHSAIFLLGGLSREDPVTPMFMHSGDIIIMSGLSRLVYHAVPRIVICTNSHPVPQSLTEEFRNENPEDSIVQTVSKEDWEICEEYMQTSRINMTVRQVLKIGAVFPSEASNKRTVKGQSDAYYDNHEENGTSEIKRKKDV